MELSKKTTILFPPDLHDRLVKLASERGVSLGCLVREACVAQYGHVSSEERLAAAEELSSLSLPVGEVHEMKRESVPEPEEPLP
jgi:hypothetical protein